MDCKWSFDPQRIVVARESRDMNQADLAKNIGATQQQISSWETGETMIGIKYLMLICGVLDCPPKFFFPSSDDVIIISDEPEK